MNAIRYICAEGTLTGRYFGTDGFRGRAGESITADAAYKVGRFLGWYYGCKGGRCKIAVGKDTRLSCYSLEYALAAGVTASGGDAYIMHVTTTASVSYVVRCDGFDCGVMISASHNQFCDNGIKLVNGRGEKLERGVINLIEDYLDGRLFIGGKPFNPPFATGDRVGRAVDFAAGRNRYIGHLVSLSANSYKGLRVGLDCANGAAYKIARSVFDALGAKVYAVGDAPNGTNVNDGCGSTHPQRLCGLVKDNALDMGFAFDGDADRCICVDGDGNVVDGDGILYAAARHLKDKGELLGDVVVATVVSNGGLEESLKEQGISLIRCPVGDSFVYEKMTECGAVLGGEQSGHVIFSKLETTGDGLVTAVKITEAVLERGAPLSELVRGFKKYPQVSVSVRVRDRAEAIKRPALKEVVERVRSSLFRGRVLVRASGTEEVIRISVEAADDGECRAACREIELAVLAGEAR